MKIILASHNQNKVKEFQEMLGEEFEIAPLTAEDVEPEETGNSYQANARLKAVEARKAYPNDFVLADDSGIEIEALGPGKPGIYTARYPDKNSSVQENVIATMKEISGSKNRRAKYKCCLALISPQGEEKFFFADMSGDLLYSPLGDNGFAYDVYFIPDKRTKTLGEMSSQEKAKISHRGQAVNQLRKYLLH
jgi:XTP/dITP diphosphohydrolase